MVPIIDAALNVVKGGMDLFSNWQKKKLAKQESQLRVNEALTEAKIKRAHEGQAHDFAWEDTAQKLSGWKDEIMMVIIITPMLACFVPGGAEWVKAGFAAMKQALPDMWWAAFWAIFGSAYGLKKFCDIKSVRSGIDISKGNGWTDLGAKKEPKYKHTMGEPCGEDEDL